MVCRTAAAVSEVRGPVSSAVDVTFVIVSNCDIALVLLFGKEGEEHQSLKTTLTSKEHGESMYLIF